ncbi:MAG: 4Fe-4S binding protein [Acetobacteraceae bacterium]|nr:4Fe-4S binding protein [Acetobacteraceae bacterium]
MSSFTEVEGRLSEEDVARESSRCLDCAVCSECLECVAACGRNAVNHADEPERVEVRAGTVVVATGFDTFDPAIAPQWGYGRFDNVITALQFERLTNASGPTGGKIVLKDGSTPRRVAILHCIGSRDDNYYKHCSRICCMSSVKTAHLVREKTRAEVYNFYIDMRTFGKGYEEFWKRVQEEGVHFIRGKGAEVAQKGGALVVRAEDTLLGVYREIPVDMVILSPALIPRKDAQDVARLFGLQRSPDGFFLEAHAKLDPMGTSTDGVYVAGACQGPKDIPDSVAQGAGAAARALQYLARGEAPVSAVIASIDEELCGGCKICLPLCPYAAISFDEAAKVSRVTEALCKGCGTCVASCPSGALHARHFERDQIMAQIERMVAV